MAIKLSTYTLSMFQCHYNGKDLFPEWIDEEEESSRPLCHEIPMPRIEYYAKMDMIVAKLPCKWPEEGWGRDIFRLQVQLIVANLAVKRGKGSYWNNVRRTKVVFLSKCRPMPEMVRLEQKVSLPVGSCNLAWPIQGRGTQQQDQHQQRHKLKLVGVSGIDQVYTVSNIKHITKTTREAYATVLHSSELYVCGAITLAQSLIQTGTERDLILLLDNSISIPKQKALVSAGWNTRIIERIRNPKAKKHSYNYSKLKLWQQTDTDKIIFLDSDIIVLRNIDILFQFPQISATGNDGSIFNSGVMVLEPSNCTFNMFMSHVNVIESYNGGDGIDCLRDLIFLTNFWCNTTKETFVKNGLFRSNPPMLHAIHYLRWKPWGCYRDYDCNWEVKHLHVYASDVVHWRWWKFHDTMDKGLHEFCGLSEKRKIELERIRKKVAKKTRLHA